MKGHYHPGHPDHPGHHAQHGHGKHHKGSKRSNHALRAIMDEMTLNATRYKALRASLAKRDTIDEELIDRTCDALIMRHRIAQLATGLETHRSELATRLGLPDPTNAH